MSYTICKVDIRDSKIESSVLTLLKEAYGYPELLPVGYLYNFLYGENTAKESFFLVAIEQDEIIGCCGFMTIDFKFNNTVYNCYQGCWAATHPKHQGRKIFINIFKKAIEILKVQEAGFIFEVAGDNTHPIFVKKLGFIEVPAIMIKIPNIKFINQFWFNKNYNKKIDYYNQSSFIPVESQILDLKMNVDEKNIHVVRIGDSLIWGKIILKKKFGIRLRYFYIGGMEIKDISDVHPLVMKIFKEYPIQYIQIVSANTNRYNELFKKWQPARINPFIFYDLNDIPVADINMMYGAIDVF